MGGIAILTGLLAFSFALGAEQREYIWMPEGIAPSSSAGVMNNAGQVAVNITTDPDQPRAGLWSIADQSLIRLEPLASGERRAHAAGVNNHGTVIGTLYKEDTNYNGASFTNRLAQPFVWSQEKGMRLLPTLGGLQTILADINDINQTVGWGGTPDTLQRACLWPSASSIEDLGSMGGRNSQAMAINNYGLVVGTTDVSGHSQSPYIHSLPFVWQQETGMVPLDPLPGYDHGGQAFAVNDSGYVALSLYKGIGGEHPMQFYMAGAPFLWHRDHGYLALPKPQGYNDVRPKAINNRAEVLLVACNVPTEDRSTCRQFLLSEGELIELAPIEGADQTHYSALNDQGWIAGSTVTIRREFFGLTTSRSTKGFVVKPLLRPKE